MQFFFLEKNIAGKGKGNKKCSNSTDDGANCCHRCIHKISRTISENTHPPLDCLIRIELHLVHKIHDFPVIVCKFPYPTLHLRNKFCNTVHQTSNCCRKLRNQTEHDKHDHPHYQYDRKKKTDRSCKLFCRLTSFLFCLSK